MIKKAAMLLIGLVFLMSTAQAGSPAVVANDFACPGIAVVAGEIVPFLLEGKEVISTNDIMTCKGTLPADIPRPDKAMHLDSSSIPVTVIYSISSGSTYDWREVITPSGQVTLTVKIKQIPTI